MQAPHVYEIHRKDKSGVDLNSEALPLALKLLLLLVLDLSGISFALAQPTPQQFRQAKASAI